MKIMPRVNVIKRGGGRGEGLIGKEEREEEQEEEEQEKTEEEENK